jgi:hypothetical protein
LYESFTVRSPRRSSGTPNANPTRRPASEYDLESVRRTTRSDAGRPAERIRGGEVDVRFVDDQDARELRRQGVDLLDRHERADGELGAQKRELRAARRERRRQRPVVRPGDLLEHPALHRDERLVEAVGRDRERHPIARVDDRPQQERQELVGPVARHDAVGGNTVEARRLGTQRRRLGIGVEPDARVDRGVERSQDRLRRRIRVLVVLS